MKFKLIKAAFLFIALSATSSFIAAQGKLEGYVKDKTERKPLTGVHISVGKVVVTTDNKGFFQVENLTEGKHKVIASSVGYAKQQQEVSITNGRVTSLEIILDEDNLYLDEVVISASRTESRISDIPGRVELISPEKISFSPAQTVDELLTLLPGVQNSRSFGLFSHKATVTMRGLSGNEQARTLVLLNGIPVNKADGGSVNWNLISSGEIDRIEVVKGPGSALYGGNAMGGIINIVTKKPTSAVEANVTADYGTYNTRGVKGKFAGNLQNGFYWTANGLYRASDGYITQSLADQLANPYTVKSTFEEKVVNVGAGYRKGEKFNADVDFTLFDDMRGTGELVYQPLGNTTDHDTYQIRSAFSGKVGELKWNASVFYLEEHYKKVNEWYKDDYTWYDVLSVRSDYGLLTGANYSVKNHSLTAGFDIRNGAVDASDIYYTSTDKVDNRGKMNFYGVYLQDEVSLLNERLKLVAGLRYDLANFYDGAFVIHSPSAETNYLDQYQFSDNDDVTWGAVSPRLSVQFKPDETFRFYAGYGRGFRPSVLDDLCRSGRVRGGLKVANPNLKPEYLDNFELGIDYKPMVWLKTSASAYYSKGTDFLYYVSTGDSIDMGFGPRPIMIRSNISDVDIMGLEIDFSASPVRFLTFYGNWAFVSSKITGYTPISAEVSGNLEGKYLTDIPMFSFTIGAMMKSKIVNAGINCRYTDKMYVNDQNVYDEIVLSDRYPATFTVDLKLSREFFKYGTVSLNIQNILDEKIYESKGAVGPGRFIVLELGVKI